MLVFCNAIILAAPLARLAWQQLQPVLSSALPSNERRLGDLLERYPQLQVPEVAHVEEPSEEPSTAKPRPWAFDSPDPAFGGPAPAQSVDVNSEEFGRMVAEEKPIVVIISIAASFLLYAPLMITFLCFYKMWVANLRPAWPEEGSPMFRNANKFSVKPFTCCEDMDTCMHGLCCGSARVADTVHATGLMNFWIVVVVTHVVSFGSSLLSTALVQYNPHAFWIQHLLLVALMVSFRQKLRQKLSGGTALPFRDAASLLEDFAMWLCCSCCAVIQEAREVDQATGVKVACCCKLKVSDQQFGTPMAMLGTNLVGDAVRVDG